MHTAKLNSAVWYTPWSLTPKCASHCGVRLLWKCLCSCFWIRFVFSAEQIKKNSLNLFFHGSCVPTAEQSFLYILFFWLCSVTHILELDSAEGCTPRSLTPQRDAHRGAWLCGMMHTVESDSAGWCTLRSLLKSRISRRNWKQIQKYFRLFIRVQIMKINWGRKSRDTVPLRPFWKFSAVSTEFVYVKSTKST